MTRTRKRKTGTVVVSEDTSAGWVVRVWADRREDAVALCEIARELGFQAKANAVRPAITDASEWRVGRLVIEYMETKRRVDRRLLMSLGEISDMLSANGYSPNTAGGVLARLCETGHIRRVTRGHYSLV